MKRKMEKVNSETIAEFLKLIDESIAGYKTCLEFINQCDKATTDILHKIEFEANSKERNKLATQLHVIRLDRRYWKDRREILEPMYNYYKDNQKQVCLLKNTLGEIRKAESYLTDRSYKPRFFKDDDMKL